MIDSVAKTDHGFILQWLLTLSGYLPKATFFIAQAFSSLYTDWIANWWWWFFLFFYILGNDYILYFAIW